MRYIDNIHFGVDISFVFVLTDPIISSMMTALACVREWGQGQEVGDLSCPMHPGLLLSSFVTPSMKLSPVIPAVTSDNSLKHMEYCLVCFIF